MLRRGKLVETLPAAGATEASLARLMVGREVLLRLEKTSANSGDSCSRSRGRASTTTAASRRPRHLVRGARRRDRRHRGHRRERPDGETTRSPGCGPSTRDGAHRRRRRHARLRPGHLEDGLGHIPEDRQRRGLVLEYSIAENIALHDYRSQPASRFGWLFPRRLFERARALIKAFDVRGGGPTTRAGGLSGGNQQKVVLAREIERDPKVLIAAQPTRGLDVGAIEFVHRRLIEERDEGRAILLVSLELEEVLSLADRILVMYEGEIAGEFPPTASEEELGIAMTGAGRGEVAA